MKKAIVALVVLFSNTLACRAQLKLVIDTTSRQKPSKLSLPTLPSNYYAQHLGFFCKEEIKLDKRITLPLRFRLGSMDYCNYLEQKPGYKLRRD